MLILTLPLRSTVSEGNREIALDGPTVSPAASAVPPGNVAPKFTITLVAEPGQVLTSTAVNLAILAAQESRAGKTPAGLIIYGE